MNKKVKKIIILISVITLIIAVGVLLAFMFKDSNEVKNKFEAPVVMCEVSETFYASTGVKSSIKIKNTGNIDEYLRLRMISYWVDGDGNIVGLPSVMPEVQYDTAEWIKGANDTYYYTGIVSPDGFTPELLTSPITLDSTTVDMFGTSTQVRQVVEIIPEAVQAAPTSAAADMWGVEITDSVITGFASGT